MSERPTSNTESNTNSQTSVDVVDNWESVTEELQEAQIAERKKQIEQRQNEEEQLKIAPSTSSAEDENINRDSLKSSFDPLNGKPIRLLRRPESSSTLKDKDGNQKSAKVSEEHEAACHQDFSTVTVSCSDDLNYRLQVNCLPLDVKQAEINGCFLRDCILKSLDQLEGIDTKVEEQYELLSNFFEQLLSVKRMPNNCLINQTHPDWRTSVRSHLDAVITSSICDIDYIFCERLAPICRHLKSTSEFFRQNPCDSPSATFTVDLGVVLSEMEEFMKIYRQIFEQVELCSMEVSEENSSSKAKSLFNSRKIISSHQSVRSLQRLRHDLALVSV